jgi:hypothetical protein
MSATPVILHFPDTAAPTLDQRRAWWDMVLNAALHFERVLGKAPRVISKAPGFADVVFAPEPLPGGPGTNVSDNTELFAATDRILRSQGRNPEGLPQMVLVMGTNLGGRAGPKPWRGFWNPADGALGVIGQRYLDKAMAVRTPTWGPWTSTERQRYFLNMWIVIHEMGHWGPVPDQIDGPPDQTMMAYPQDGKLLNPKHSIHHFLGKFEGFNPDGSKRYASFKTVGWQERELQTFDKSPVWDNDATGRRVFIFPEDRNVLLRNDIEHFPARQLTGHGLAVQEYAGIL